MHVAWADQTQEAAVWWYSLHTALLLLRWPSVSPEVVGSSRPDWHLRHLARRLNWGAYSDLAQAVADVGEVRA